MSRTRAERRKQDWAKARRKQKISKSYWDGCEWYNNLHQYSKNKVHCSCPMCSAKTNGRKKYGIRRNWTIPDLKRLDEMKYEIEEEVN